MTITETVSTAEFARLREVDVRTVKRWLEKGRILGAVKNSSGNWEIPADAAVALPLSKAEEHREAKSAAAASTAVMVPMTARDLLDVAPILLTLDQAGRILDIKRSQVAALRRQGILEGVRIDGKWRITVGSVRRLAGV